MAATLGTWPVLFIHNQQALSRLIRDWPRFEESWNGDILVIITQVFPAESPSCYIWKPQYNLRLPINNSDDRPRTSTDSTGSNNQLVAGQELGSEPKRMKLDFVIAQGHRGQQRIVALIEIKRGLKFEAEDQKRFIGYCGRLVWDCEERVTRRTSAILIVGGFACRWDRAQMDMLVVAGTPALTSEVLEAMKLEDGRTARVDSPAFWTLLEDVRETFAAPNY